MRWSLPLILSLSLLPASALPADAPAAPAPGDAILGRWKPSGEDVVVAISASGGGYGGAFVVAPANPSLAGKPMFRGLVYDGKKGEWSGEVFAVKKGEFVPAVIRLSGEGFVLTAGKGFMSKKVTWTREAAR
jgi:uncharacterized protein (DUF2147 family)